MSEIKAIDYYTVLDRSSIILSNWDDFVLDGDSVQDDHELREMAQKISELMGGFYQAVGVKWDEAQKAEETILMLKESK